MAGGCHDVAIGDLGSSRGSKELLADRKDRLQRMGTALPAGIHVDLPSVPVLVQALLGQAPRLQTLLIREAAD